MTATFDLTDADAPLRGVATLLKTPFDADGQLDEESYARQVRHVIEAGTVLLIPGMQGSETYCLPPAGRRRCIEISLSHAHQRVPVCAAVGGLSVAEVVEAAASAEAMGANMIAVIPPTWVKNEDDVTDCIGQVAGAVSVPVMFHSIFGHQAAIVFSTTGIAAIVRKWPNVRWVKIEGPKWISQAVAVKAEIGDLLAGMMSGPEFVMCYQAGCSLFMVAADLIEPVVAIFEALEGGDLAEARRIEALLRNVVAVKGYCGGEIGNKTIMARRGIFSRSGLGRPQMTVGPRTLTTWEEEELTEALRPLLPFFKTAPPVPPAK